ncbi:MAG: hypothetical protein ACLR10_09005 [Oscillospiraceae bacterium]
MTRKRIRQMNAALLRRLSAARRRNTWPAGRTWCSSWWARGISSALCR